jgi:hypothetical protein
MSNEDRYPHFDFNFRRIREHWTTTLGCYRAAAEYLRVVERRIRYWLQEQGSWIDYEFAARHLEEDLGLKDTEGRLTWLALRHRLHLANEQQRRLAPRHRRRDADGILIEVRQSSDGVHDQVWHADFTLFYMKAVIRERRELERLRCTGIIPLDQDVVAQKSPKPDNPRSAQRSGIQWIWTNRLLAYLFEALREKEAFYDDGEMWAALDGVFKDRKGNSITRKDLALWAHQYHNNRAESDTAGKPKKYELIDKVIEQIEG